MTDDDAKKQFGAVAPVQFSFEQLSTMFNKPFGDAMRQFGLISDQQYWEAGHLQALSIVVVGLEKKFGEKISKAVEDKYGPMGNVPFQSDMSASEIVEDFETFVRELAADNDVDDVDQRIAAAEASIKEALTSEGSVDDNAIPIGAIHKGLYLKGKEKGMIPNAFFAMQFSLRYLGVLRTWQKTPNEAVHVAQKVLKQNNKYNPGKNKPDEKYWADPEWVQEAHYALRTVCNTVMGARGRELLPHEEAAFEYHSKAVVAAMENSARMFEEVDQPVLATMGRQLREELATNYLGLDQDAFTSATPDALEQLWRDSGQKADGNSPHMYLMRLVG